jgi:hypothetical protein
MYDNKGYEKPQNVTAWVTGAVLEVVTPVVISFGMTASVV